MMVIGIHAKKRVYPNRSYDFRHMHAVTGVKRRGQFLRVFVNGMDYGEEDLEGQEKKAKQNRAERAPGIENGQIGTVFDLH